jgi:mitochondrial fission protein ELM1
MTQRINDYAALYTAAHDLAHIGEESVLQMNWLIGDANALGSSWSDAQYARFQERMEEYRDGIAVFAQKNIATCEAVVATAKKIEEYLATLDG